MDLDNLFKNTQSKNDTSSNHQDLIISKDSGFIESVCKLYAIEDFPKPLDTPDLEQKGDWSSATTSLKNVILDLRESTKLIDEVAEVSAKLDISVKIIVVSNQDSIRIKNKVLELGANYALWDEELNELLSIIVSAAESNISGTIKTREAKRILLLGTKGGIGVSTLASSLGHALSNGASLRTLLVDHDSYAINSDIFLAMKGVKPRQISEDLNDRDVDSAIAHTYINKVQEKFDFLAMEKAHECIGLHTRMLSKLSGEIAGEYNFIIDAVPVNAFDEICAHQDLSTKYHRIYVICDTSVASLRAYNQIRKNLNKSEHSVIFIHNRPVKDYLVSVDDAKERMKQKNALYIGYEAGLEKRLIQQGQITIEKTKLKKALEDLLAELVGKPKEKKFRFSLFKKS
ncbi:type II secretion protein [Vibrio sp. JC009]|uniref:AAA family ATPase n=1 Tax=Vibrio sp. JC009 TaxID=2912314 RepID=UPI0023B10A02|nr:ArsA-related P-loop ATPase [Vibrio sp. JC009]WED24568.1 type II secretion protein [Vibrio sp. JC009]